MSNSSSNGEGSGITRAPAPASLPTLTGFSEISQLAMISADADATVKALRDALGVGSFKVFNMEPPALFDTQYKGEAAAWSMTLAVSWVGNTQLEVIEPLTGRTVFTDYLERTKGRVGIQHVFLERDGFGYQEGLDALTKAGYPTIQQAKIAGDPGAAAGLSPEEAASLDSSFGYAHGAQALKIDLELGEFAGGISLRTALGVTPATRWIPEDNSEHYETVPKDSILKDIDAFYILTKDLAAASAGFAKLTDRPLEPTKFDGDLLPGKGQLASMRLKTSILNLVQPNKGPLMELYNEQGEGMKLLRGRPLGTIDQASAALTKRGWALTGLPPAPGRDAEALYATHKNVPFALWIHTADDA